MSDQPPRRRYSRATAAIIRPSGGTIAEDRYRNKWPPWATEPVEITDADPAWPQRAEREISQLRELLAPWLIEGIHHIGSTAVPNLPAKPIIDLMAGVGDLDVAPAVADVLETDNWHYVPPELDRRAWRRFFVKVEDETRVAHLHLIDPSHPRWKEQLQFRETLRANPDIAAEYAVLKRQLAKRHPDDREAYSRAKEDFVRAVLESSPQ